MRRVILSALVLVLSAAVADAGPLLNLIENRREARAARRGGCQSCPQQYAAPQQAGGVTYTLSGGSCANGSCPIPQAVPAQFPATLPGSVPAK